MGIYQEYLDSLKGYKAVQAERTKQLRRIAKLRGNAVLSLASDLSPRSEKANAPTGIDYTDLVPISDLLDKLDGERLDVILETPGGYAESAEDIVRMIRGRFSRVAFIVPGAARSAGTIMVMSGDEILLDANSSLGPIDAQVSMGRGGRHSADAFLEGLRKIKEETEKSGQLNKAYIPVLGEVTPATIQACENAQDFSQKLVRDWLVRFKFSTWTTHSSTGLPVTQRQKQARARAIARRLCDHSHWLTHGRSIKMEDLVEIGLKVSDYGEEPELRDAIRRYHVLLRMTFESTALYKVFETQHSGIFRSLAPVAPVASQQPNRVNVDFACPKCGNKTCVQADIGSRQALQKGCVPFPSDNHFTCPHCGLEADLSDLRKQIEAQAKKPIVG